MCVGGGCERECVCGVGENKESEREKDKTYEEIGTVSEAG